MGSVGAVYAFKRARIGFEGCDNMAVSYLGDMCQHVHTWRSKNPRGWGVVYHTILVVYHLLITACGAVPLWRAYGLWVLCGWELVG